MPQIATIPLLKQLQEIECSSFRNSVDDIVAITARCSYGSSSTQELRISIFYSPDGKNYDTIPFTFFDIDFKANAVQQKTQLIEILPAGIFTIKVKNMDSGKNVTNISLFINKERTVVLDVKNNTK